MKLGRLGNLFLALVCLAGMAQQWLDEGSVTWWRYAAALMVAGLLYEWLSVRGTALAVTAPAAVELRLGREQDVDLHFLNGDAAARELEFLPVPPPDISIRGSAQRLHLGPGERAAVSLPLTAHDIGRHRWRGLPARMRGPLGLAWWSLKLPLAMHVGCVPDLAGRPRRIEGSRAGGDRARRAGAGMELHHLREYVPGDPLHTIHWKATGRSKRLITRVMSEEQQLDIMLLLDIGRTSRTRVDGMSQFGHYLNLASTFSRFALAGGDAVGLVAAADRPLLALPPRHGARANTLIHRALRDLQPQAGELDMPGAALLVQKLARKRSLVIVVTDLYGQALSGGFGRSLKLWGARHLSFVVGLVGDDVTRLARRAAEREEDAYVGLAAAEYCSSLEANGEAARRLGAHTVVARPADVQQRVIEEYCRVKARREV